MESSVATCREDVASAREGSTPLAPAWPESKGRERGSILARMLLAGDVLAAVTATVLAGWIAGLAPAEQVVFTIGATIAWPLTAFALGLYNGGTLRFWVSGVSEVPQALAAIVLFSWPVFIVAMVAGTPAPGAAALWTVLLTAVLSPLTRASVRAKLHRVAPLRQRAVIVGSGVVAGRLVEKMRTQDQYGVVPIGLVDDSPYEIGTPDLPRLGHLGDLEQVIRELAVDRVVIAFSKAGHEELLHCIRVCRSEGVAVDVVPRLFEFLDCGRELDQVAGLPLLSIGSPHLTRSSQVAKRTLDVAVSALLIFALAPLIAVIAIAIKVESPGPVFFRQPRPGRGQRMFDMLKFRSMYTDAAVRLNGDGVVVKGHVDPRTTRVGRFLRRFSLDELPQLLNVVRGEMSLVGPRPLVLEETATLDESWHARRFDLRPGLTGPWQIQGRSDTPF